MKTVAMEKDNKKILHIEGDLNFEEALSLEDFLSDALEPSNDIEIDLQKISSIDLKSMQLIYLAKRFARTSKRNIVFKVKFSEAFRKALKNAALGHDLIKIH